MTRLKPNLEFPFPITSVTTRKVKENRKGNLPLSNISVTGPICVKANPEPTSYGTCRQRASSVMGCRPVTSSGQKKHAFGLWLAARVTPSTTAEQSACCQHLPAHPARPAFPKAHHPQRGGLPSLSTALVPGHQPAAQSTGADREAVLCLPRASPSGKPAPPFCTALWRTKGLGAGPPKPSEQITARAFTITSVNFSLLADVTASSQSACTAESTTVRARAPAEVTAKA